MQTFAILPAAGRSERMGRPKLLLPWGERTIIEHVVATWAASRVDRVIVVVHPDDGQIAQLAVAGGAIVVQPPTPPSEMKESVRWALAEVRQQFQPAALDAWLLAPADMPALTHEAIDRLIGAYVRNASGAVPQEAAIFAAAKGRRRGHPVLFTWLLAAEVDHLRADEGINAIVERHPVRLVEVEGAGIWQDLDTPEDYERLRPR